MDAQLRDRLYPVAHWLIDARLNNRMAEIKGRLKATPAAGPVGKRTIFVTHAITLLVSCKLLF
jgi:hypothetical protein